MNTPTTPTSSALPRDASDGEGAEVRYIVAVWWRQAGYGGGYTYATVEKAQAAAKKLLSQGYANGEPGHGDEVRVRKITTELWRVTA